MKLNILSCIVVYLWSFSFVYSTENFPEVQTSCGTVRGYFMQSTNNRKFAAYEGVPYAKPPVGKRRFKEPELLKEWNGVWVANETVRCLQYSHFKDGNAPQLQGQEDCLFLNIYTPHNATSKSKLDVIIHIHGGAFMYGAGHVWQPHFLMDHDVVYINLNYRLGPLGFLSTGNDVVPGNNGLKDQTTALRWIKRNVQFFGGNKNSITLTGLSAGGASVTYHFVSPMSRGLFNKGYAYSGVNLNSWALTENAPEKAKKLGSLLGCNTTSSKVMVDCLRHRPAHQIVHNILNFMGYFYNPFTPFGPTIEPPNKNAFLTNSSYSLMNSGSIQDLPLIISTVENEGLYPAAEFQADISTLPEIDQNWSNLAPYILDYNDTLPEEKRIIVADQIRNYYLGSDPISNQTYKKLVKMVSDRLFISTCEQAAKLFAQSMKSKVYYLQFSYRGPLSTSSRLAQNNNNYGVSHADDLLYLYRLYNIPENSRDWLKMQKIYMDILLSYAKSSIPSVPNVKWEPVNGSDGNINYLHVESPDKIEMKSTSSLSSRDFWESLPFLENNKSL